MKGVGPITLFQLWQAGSGSSEWRQPDSAAAVECARHGPHSAGVPRSGPACLGMLSVSAPGFSRRVVPG